MLDLKETRSSGNIQYAVSHNKLFYRFKTLESRYIEEWDRREV